MSRDRLLRLRVTAEEKAAFEFAAAEAGLTLSDFARQRLLTARVRLTSSEREAARHLARIGANLNQLARWANTHKGHAEAIEVILCLDELRAEVRKVGDRSCT